MLIKRDQRDMEKCHITSDTLIGSETHHQDVWYHVCLLSRVCLVLRSLEVKVVSLVLCFHFDQHLEFS
jgi:hypothetical protein